MNGPYDSRNAGLLNFGGTSIGGFLVIAAVFLAVLTLGYLNYARVIWPGAPFLVQIVGGLVIAVCAMVLARTTAANKVRSRLRGGPVDRTWVLFFVVLLSISALGTLNAMFYFFEGDEVADQRVEEARHELAQLKEQGTRALTVPEYSALTDKVNQLLGDLHDRIFTVAGGNSCGIGEDSRKIIAKLGASDVLPGYAFIPFTDTTHECSQVQQLKIIYDKYDKKAKEQLTKTAIYRDKQVAAHEAAASEVGRAIDISMADLSKVTTEVDSSSRGVARDYRSLQSVLKTAADTYKQQLSAVNSLSAAPLVFDNGKAAPDRLEINDVVEIGNLGFIIKNVVLRLDRGQTYLYLFLAVALDALMVWAFTTLMTEMAEEAREGPTPVVQDIEARVHYLWN